MIAAPLLPRTSARLRRVYAFLLAAAAISVIGYAALFYALSGWGMGTDDLAYAVNVPVAYGGLLALPAFVAALRSGGAQARWARGLLWAAAGTALFTIGAAWVDADACSGGCPAIVWVVVPFMTVVVAGGRLALALPLLAAGGRSPLLVASALGIFAVGAAIGTIPYVVPSGEFDRFLLLATVGLLAVLGGAYLAVAWGVWRSTGR